MHTPGLSQHSKLSPDRTLDTGIQNVFPLPHIHVLGNIWGKKRDPPPHPHPSETNKITTTQTPPPTHTHTHIHTQKTKTTTKDMLYELLLLKTGVYADISTTLPFQCEIISVYLHPKNIHTITSPFQSNVCSYCTFTALHLCLDDYTICGRMSYAILFPNT